MGREAGREKGISEKRRVLGGRGLVGGGEVQLFTQKAFWAVNGGASIPRRVCVAI